MVYGSLVPDLNNNRQPIEYWVHFVYSNWTRFRYDGINPPIIVPNISEIRGMEIVAGNLYIAGRDPTTFNQTILQYDGTMLDSLDLGPDLNNVEELTPFDASLYFTGRTNHLVSELWRTAGNSGEIVADVVQGSGSSFLHNLAAFGGSIYFEARDAPAGRELWRHQPNLDFALSWTVRDNNDQLVAQSDDLDNSSFTFLAPNEGVFTVGFMAQDYFDTTFVFSDNLTLSFQNGTPSRDAVFTDPPAKAHTRSSGRRTTGMRPRRSLWSPRPSQKQPRATAASRPTATCTRSNGPWPSPTQW